MPLLAWERRAAIDLGVEISGEEVFHKSRNHQMLWLYVWQLNPIREEVFSNPEAGHISSLTSLFLLFVCNLLLLVLKTALYDPIILLGTVDLSEERERLSPAQNLETFHRLLQKVDIIFPKVDTSPLEHLGLLQKVWDLNHLSLREKVSISG